MPNIYTQKFLYDVIEHVRNDGLQVSFRPEETSLDGQRIVIPTNLESNVRHSVFLILHLAGHSAQWRDSTLARGLALVDADSFPLISQEEQKEVIKYELMGTVVGLSFMPDEITDKIWGDMYADAKSDVEMLMRAYGASTDLVAYVSEVHKNLPRRIMPVRPGNFIRWNRLSGTRIL